MGSDWGNLENYSTDITTMGHLEPFSSPSTLYSPMSQAIRNERPMASSTSVTSPSRNCCHSLTCSTFGSTFAWGAALPSPASDSFSSSSPPISGVISPLIAPGINQEMIPNIYIQPSNFQSCESHDVGQHGGNRDGF
ncbi:hypothetical protein ACJQWK_03855 [Exserohilum turcicum]